MAVATAATVILVGPVPQEQAAAGPIEDACQDMKKFFGAEGLPSGTYGGKFSAGLEATGFGAIFTLDIRGTLELVVAEGAVRSASGPARYEIHGDAPGLPGGGVFDLDATAKGKLDFVEGDPQTRFTMRGTGKGLAKLIAKAGPVDASNAQASSEEDTVEFSVAKADCHGAEGTLDSAVFDQTRAAFEAQGLAVSVSDPPRWSVGGSDPELEKAIAELREQAAAIPTKPRDFNGFQAEINALVAEIPDDAKPCALAVLLEAYRIRIPAWLTEASNELDDVLDGVLESADPAQVARIEPLLIEVSTYITFGMMMGVATPGSIQERLGTVSRAIRSFLSVAIDKGDIPAAVEGLSFAVSIYVTASCIEGDDGGLSEQMVAHFAEESTKKFASILANLEEAAVITESDQGITAGWVAAERFAHNAVNQVPTALGDYCRETGRC